MSTPKDWEQLKAAFNEIADAPAPMRDALLGTLRNQHPELAAEVERMLARDADSYGFLDTPIIGDRDERNPLIGTRLGAYRVLREIGHGGMGSVFLAEREGDFQKRAAIKVIRRGMDTDFIIDRFHRERQILAGLEHPHIAQLLDGGATPDGLPYLALEYVDGTPIAEFCREHDLEIAQRLHIFIKACAAVHHAHQRLIVHRDLKPANILVTEDGTPKLLDFGVAKLLDPTEKDRTATIARMMTPEYASPEQLAGQPVSTTSDIYSLGVVLFELLTGERARHSASGDLPLMSSVAPPALRRAIAGDLDTIVAKATRAEPERRYDSARQFADDLERYLSGQPVIARPDTIRYRTGKFLRRNAAAAIATGALFIAMIAGGIMIVTEAREARRQQQLAEHRLADVRRIAGSFMFDIHDELRLIPGATTAREVLVRNAAEYLERIDRDGGADPDLRCDLAIAYQRLAEIQGRPGFANLGDMKTALKTCEHASAIASALVAEHPDVDRYRNALTNTLNTRASILTATGDLRGARDTLLRARDEWRALFARHPASQAIARDLSFSYMLLADLEGDSRNSPLGDYRSAAGAATAGLAVVKKIRRAAPEDHGFQHYEGSFEYRLAGASAGFGDNTSAIAHYSRAIEIFKGMAARFPTVGPIRRDLAKCESALALLLVVDQPREALALATHAASLADGLHLADPADLAALELSATIREQLAEVELSAHESADADLAKAIAELSEIVAKSPANLTARVTLSNAEAVAHKSEDAVRNAKEVLAASPHHAGAQRVLALASTQPLLTPTTR